MAIRPPRLKQPASRRLGEYPESFQEGPLVRRLPSAGDEPAVFLRPESREDVVAAGLRHVDRYYVTSPDHLRGPAALVAEARRMGTLRSEDGPRDHQQTVTEPAYRDEVDARNRERLGITPLPKRGSAEALLAVSKRMLDDRLLMSGATGQWLGEAEVELHYQRGLRDRPDFVETPESTELLVSSARAALDEMGLKPGMEVPQEAQGLVSELQAYDAQVYHAEQSDLGIELPGVDGPASLSWADEQRRVAGPPGQYHYDDYHPIERNRAAFAAVGGDFDQSEYAPGGPMGVAYAASEFLEDSLEPDLVDGAATAEVRQRLRWSADAQAVNVHDPAALDFPETAEFVDMCRLAISEQTRDGSELSAQGVELLAAIQMRDAAWHAQHGDRTLSVEAPVVAPSVDDVVTARQQRFPELRQEVAGAEATSESEGVSLG